MQSEWVQSECKALSSACWGRRKTPSPQKTASVVLKFKCSPSFSMGGHFNEACLQSSVTSLALKAFSLDRDHVNNWASPGRQHMVKKRGRPPCTVKLWLVQACLAHSDSLDTLLYARFDHSEPRVLWMEGKKILDGHLPVIPRPRFLHHGFWLPLALCMRRKDVEKRFPP